MQTSGACGAVKVRGAIAVLSISAALAGCGGSHPAARTSASASPPGVPAGAASTTANPAANPVAAPPIPDAALKSGSTAHQISMTIAAFYRAAWEDNAQGACALFSPNGANGFLHAAKVSFPGSVNGTSTCAEAMKIYNASLATSVQQLQNSDPSVSGSTLNSVKVGKISVRGNAATAIGPLNALPEINPKLIKLVRMHGRWLIDGSYSLSKSNLPSLIKRAPGKHK
jgi:hypothetical protein